MQIEHLATAPDVRKVSRRDLPVVVAHNLMERQRSRPPLGRAPGRSCVRYRRHRRSAPVYALMRKAERPPLSRCFRRFPDSPKRPSSSSAAGPKRSWVFPATLEWLETHGVTVVGYGTDCFPAFYNRDSGLPVDVRADTPEEVAALFRGAARLPSSLGFAGHRAGARPSTSSPPDQMEAAIGPTRRWLRPAISGVHGKGANAVPARSSQRAYRRSKPAS